MNIYLIIFLSLVFCVLLNNYFYKKEYFTNSINIDNIFNNIMKYKKYTPKKISDKPWIVTLDTFLSPKECKQLINLSNSWSDSVTVKNNKNKTDNKYRNSFSFNCHKKCLDEKIVKIIDNRINEVTTINKQNYEELTMTKYNKGGFYKRHHDYILKEDNEINFKKQGPRILTVLLYLTNDYTGGETSFFHLGYKVKPKIGRALIWTNVYNNLEKDEITAHEALAVKSGTKIISQIWIHSKSFR
jgi:prolyl 4-hydroxylase